VAFQGLLHWAFVEPDKWPVDDNCAPAVRVVRDTLYVFQCTFGLRPLFTTTTPWNGHLDFFNPRMPPLSGALGPWDLDFFHDHRGGFSRFSAVFSLHTSRALRRRVSTHLDSCAPSDSNRQMAVGQARTRCPYLAIQLTDPGVNDRFLQLLTEFYI